MDNDIENFINAVCQGIPVLKEHIGKCFKRLSIFEEGSKILVKKPIAYLQMNGFEAYHPDDHWYSFKVEGGWLHFQHDDSDSWGEGMVAECVKCPMTLLVDTDRCINELKLEFIELAEEQLKSKEEQRNQFKSKLNSMYALASDKKYEAISSDIVKKQNKLKDTVDKYNKEIRTLKAAIKSWKN